MNIREFTSGILMLIIPLIIIIFIYRLYITQICHNNQECIKRKLYFDMDAVSKKLKNTMYRSKEPEQEIVVEGFVSGLTDWFMGSTPSPPLDAARLNVDPPSPEPSNETMGELKDAPNSDLLNSLQEKSKKLNSFKTKKMNSIEDIKKINEEMQKEMGSNKIDVSMENKKNIQQNFSPEIVTDPKLLKKEVTAFTESPVQKETPPQPQNVQSLLGNCNFYSDKCPSTHIDLGSIGLNGLESNVMLSCGNVENTKPAKAIAKIRNNGVDEIVVMDKGHGFNPSKPPNVKVMGGRGNDAQLEAVVDDDGYLTLIKIIHPGYNYTETPNIIIDPPLMNSTCHFCCKK